MSKYFAPLEPGKIYHMFNRAVGSEKLFRSHENYTYFLRRMKHHLSPYTNIWAYSLLPNHFHLLIQIKPFDDIMNLWDESKKVTYNPFEHHLSEFLMQPFSNWFNGYTKAYNHMYQRKGALFIDYVRRSHANSDLALANFIFYIHKNAIHHGLTPHIGAWPYDSYQHIIEGRQQLVSVDEILNYFGSVQEFIRFHQQPVHRKTKVSPAFSFQYAPEV